jgi:hypothetical protein
MHTVVHLRRQQLEAGLASVRRSIADGGRVEEIVISPEEDERRSLESCRLSPELGVDGDNWARSCWLKLPDGSPDPDVQVAIINSRLIDLLAGSRERWRLAGDNLYVDLDLSADNLPPGTRLTAGGALLEITQQEHRACKKFGERYGHEAVHFVNGPEHRQMNLRGIYAKVITAGIVSIGDAIRKA